MLSKFALILQVNRACNLCCDYCYTGSKAHHPMPDAIGRLLEYLWGLGLRRLALSLDLWTQWKAEDLAGLALGLRSCADLWRGWLPQAELNWFSEKAATLGGWDVFAMSARCGFGVGQVAVASSGRLYPCERVMGDDLATQPLQLPGTVWSGSDFLEFEPAAERSATACQTPCATAVARAAAAVILSAPATSTGPTASCVK